MKLTYLEASGFKHLRGSQGSFRIDFSEGIIGIRGPNESGKTSVMEAVFFSLFGRTMETESKLEDYLAYGRTKALLRLGFESEGEKYEVVRTIDRDARGTRSTARLFKLKENRRELIASGKMAVDAEISNMLGGMGPEEARSTIFVMQKDLARIKEKTRKDRRELIDKIMMRESFDKAIEELNEERKRLEGAVKTPGELRRAREELERLKAKLTEYKNRKKELNEVILKIQALKGPEEEESSIAHAESMVKRLNSKLTALRKFQEYVNMKQQFETELRSSSKRLETIDHRIEEKRRRLSEIRGEIELRRKFKDASLKLQKIKELADSKEREAQNSERKARPFEFLGIMVSLVGIPLIIMLGIKYLAVLSIGLVIALYGVQLHARAGQLRKERADLLEEARELGTAAEKYREINKFLEEEERIDREIEQLEQERSTLVEEIDGIRTSLESLLEPELPPDVPEFSPAILKEIEIEFRRWTQELGNRKGQLKQLEDRLVSIREYLERNAGIEEKIEEQQKKVKELERKLNTVKYAIKLLEESAEASRKAVIPAVSEGMSTILPVITLNRYLAVAVNESYDVFVYDSSAGEYKELRSFSGGTQDQILLSMRLAFTLSLVPSVRGAHPEFLFLDEVLASSDSERREKIMELMARNLKKSFKQVIVISHQEDVLRYADTKVEMRDGVIERISSSWGDEAI